jgi:MEMO1 family protein
MAESVRPPAVAGSFYPASPGELSAVVDRLLAGARVTTRRCPKVLIAPHAGYVYSGPIAASAFARIVDHGAQIERILLVGPSHRVRVASCLAMPRATRFATPLGELAVDEGAVRGLRGITTDATAHAREHSLEVMLPFVQRIAPRATIVPLVGNDAQPEVVGSVLDALWGGPETLIVISSDLSHYLSYDEGRARDRRTVAQIVALAGPVADEDACGSVGINGLLCVARRKQLHIECLDLRSSGDTAGSRDEVVGYAAFAAWEHEAAA